MSEEIWDQILAEIKRQEISFGSCEVKLTYHDGRIDFYEITTRYRRNTRSPAGKSGTEGGIHKMNT